MPPASDLPTAAVVVPTYNRGSQLAEVLRPLLDDPATAELIVVADGCTDETPRLLADLAAGDARLRPVLQDNAGEAAARQRGLEHARSDVVLFVDDDVVAEPDLVTGHAAAHVGLDRGVVVGYMPTWEPGEGPGPAFTTMLYRESYERRCEAYERDPGGILRHLWAGNLSIRRDLALAVGMGNADYRERYHPDQELGLRLLAAGGEARFDRRLRATHRYERSWEAFVRDARSQGAGASVLRRLHPGSAPPLAEDRFEHDTPRPVAALVRLTRRRRAAAAVGAALGLLTRLLPDGAPRLAPARLARRVHQQRGAIDARAGRRPA